MSFEKSLNLQIPNLDLFFDVIGVHKAGKGVALPLAAVAKQIKLSLHRPEDHQHLKSKRGINKMLQRKAVRDRSTKITKE